MPHAHAHSNETEANLAIRLQNAHISFTPTRIAILKLLAESHRVWSIEQLIAALKKTPKATRGSLIFTTVYRCLIKLEEAKLVRRADLGDGISRYEYDSGLVEHHHHVVCRKCKGVTPLDHCKVLELDAMVKRMGYRDVDHRLEFFGICKPCQKKKELI